ncbi:MAG: SRPBCC domain-containing protein [Bacteroidota bacterium]
MFKYETEITINKPIEEVWKALIDFGTYPTWNPLVGKVEGDLKEGGTINAYIVPLKQTFKVKLLKVRENEEMTWKGNLAGLDFLINGVHYYRLKAIDENTTHLDHGETFTGILSNLVPKKQIQATQKVFEAHNEALKARLDG